MKIGMQMTTLGRQARRCAGVAALIVTLAGLGGCETDSFIDPSFIGRWEFTPTIMPVLDRLSSIEDDTGESVQSSPIRPGDLIPESDQYRFGSGDQIEVHIRDFFVIGAEESFDRVIDPRGYLDIPRLPPIRVQGKTVGEITTAIEETIRAQRINERPVVSINIKSQRRQTFSVLGAVKNPGTYYVPSPDYRLLEGLTTAGGIDETRSFLYIIRQVYLTEEAAGVAPATEPAGPTPGRPKPLPSSPDKSKQPDEDLIKLIDELSKQPPKDAKPNPGMFAEALQPASSNRVATKDAPKAGSPPPIDLPDSSLPSISPGPPSTGEGTASGWVYVDGKWVKAATAPGEGGTDQGGESGKKQVAQRVLKVPVAPLLAGDAEFNVVIRPGDVIRVPPVKTGLVYLSGAISRPGPYNLPTDGRLTLLRAVDSAGGLNGVGIPERVDLTRRIGEDKQATIRLNLRAIAEQTQPDIFLKPDDRITIGSNFWATPLAILRSGFRASYGFGFILDRNFAENIFGRTLGTGG